MEEYILKSTLVAEIERRLKKLYELLPDASKVEKEMITISEACNTGKYTALESFKNYLDTLEVKEVDLEKEYDRYYEQERNIQTFKLAKHFFELGLKSQKEFENEDLIDLHKTCEWVRKNYGEEAVFNFCKAIDE